MLKVTGAPHHHGRLVRAHRRMSGAYRFTYIDVFIDVLNPGIHH
jgi:hypothetical protein